MPYLITEVAIYRRRYVSKDPPGTDNNSICTMVGSSIELPEGYVLETPIKEIKYKVEEIPSNTEDFILKQCIGRLCSLEELEPKEKKVKKAKVDKVLSVEPKPKREKIDWGSIADSL